MARVTGPHAIPSSHPSLPGHFPGAPIVPGVVLLSYVLASLQEAWGPFELRRLRSAKLLRPLAPGTPFRIEADEEPAGVLRFACHAEAGVLARGTLEIER